MRYRLPVMSLSWKMSLRPRSLLEAMPKYSLKSRPRSWCSFFRQLLTTGIYPSVVFWFWPVIKPASPASLFKWHLSPIYLPVGGVPISHVSMALYDTQRLGLHGGGMALSPFPPYSHKKFFFSNGNEGGVSWDRFCPDGLTSNLLCWSREHASLICEVHSVCISFLSFIPKVNVKFKFYMQLLGRNRVCSNAWN